MPSLKLPNPFRRGDDRPSLKERAAALKETAGRVIGHSVPQRADDPAFAAILEHRSAYAAWEPYLDEINEELIGSAAFNAAEAAGETCRVREGEAFAALIAARPTTLAGLLAVTKYLPGAIARNGRDRPDDDGVMAFATICGALQDAASKGAIIADASRARARLQLPAPADHDLSACTLPQLARLYEASRGLFRYLASATDAHFFSTSDGREFTPAGKVLDQECSRAGIILDAIVQEVRERAPKDRAERQERARVLALYELSNSSVIEDADVLAELVAATRED
ncbi:hypothetical protein MKK55_11530 [Methylobacterium sp. J-059]|uniref:hypothetical protein n=1 Tax=Methylobacterium sp. J-059 TaxID=2836643 RepID=UPI001FBBEA54|nr:hypothetical protein [Methylobacterium sp. J-059]MCJ2039567.1 hypothetical protein [Methylobacterium sp. J-059]